MDKAVGALNLPPAMIVQVNITSMGEGRVEQLAIFMVCVGILALIWTSVRTDRKRDRR
jgi:hypothetical protein